MIESARLEDDSMYQCQVGATENTAGIRSRNAVLSVLCKFSPLGPETQPSQSVFE
jgi:hypothetical protein